MEQTKTVGNFSPLEKTIFFQDGSTHKFKSAVLTRSTPEEVHQMIHKWARFKGVIAESEEIAVPGFIRDEFVEETVQ